MKNMKMILIALILATALSSVFAEDNSAAIGAGLGIDARSIGMGGTGAAFLDNVTSAYINPAALADVKRLEFASATRQNDEWDKKQHAAALGFELPFGYVALSWQNLGVNGLKGYSENATPTGDFDNNEHVFGVSYAAKLGHFNFGLTPKMYMSKIEDESTTGYSFDLGAVYHLNRYFNLGFVARDLISDYDGNGTTIPREFIPSIAAFPIPGLVVAADLSGYDDFDQIKMRLGAEYWIGLGEEDDMGSSISGIRIKENTTWTDVFSSTKAGIRCGINDGNFTGGFGVRFKMLEMNYAFESASEDYENDNHIYSLILRF